MPWVLIPLAALVLAGWSVWLNYKKSVAESSGALAERVGQQEAELQAAKRRIANLETIVVHSLEEGSEKPSEKESTVHRAARLAAAAGA